MLTSLCICSHVRCNVPHVFLTRSHIHLAGGGPWYRVHLLTCSMSRSTHPPDMITHIFGKEGDVNVFVHLLTGSTLRSTHVLDMITHTFGRHGDVDLVVQLLTCCYVQHVFLTPSHILLADRGKCVGTCSHVRCYVPPHIFPDMITHIFGKEGDVNVFVHLLTGSTLRSTHVLDMITHTFGRHGDVDLVVQLLTCCYVRHMFLTRSHIRLADRGKYVGTCSHVRCYSTSHIFPDMITHIFGKEGDVNVFVHLLTGSTLRSTHVLDMVTHTFGRHGDVDLVVQLLTCCYVQHVFLTPSHIRLADRGKCVGTCSHVRCYVPPHIFPDMITHIFGKEGDVNVFVHLLTGSTLRSTHVLDMITHTFG